MMGGDRAPEKAQAATQAMVAGIKEFDHRSLLTAHFQPEHSPIDVWPEASWLDLNTTYTYKLIHDLLRQDYRRTPVRPFVLIESTYEGEHNASHVQVRRQAWWAVFYGTADQFMGNRPIWLREGILPFPLVWGRGRGCGSPPSNL